MLQTLRGKISPRATADFIRQLKISLVKTFFFHNKSFYFHSVPKCMIDKQLFVDSVHTSKEKSSNGAVTWMI